MNKQKEKQQGKREASHSEEEIRGFASYLKGLAEDCDLRNIDIVNATGIKAQNISELMSGSRAPSRSNLINLKKVFGDTFIRKAYEVLYPEIK